MNVLLVSPAFPHKQDAEVLQTAKLYKYLSAIAEFGLHVVTSPTPSSSIFLYNRLTGDHT